MKKLAARYGVPYRLVVILTVLTVALALLDLVVHHHLPQSFLPHFAPFVVLSLLGSILFILVALCLVPLISRKGDYYDR